MESKKNWLLRLLLFLFTISVSITIVPSGVVNVFGTFGEMFSFITENVEKEVGQIKSEIVKSKKVKGHNIFNIWFVLLVQVIYLCFLEYMIRLPRGDTIITLKVRMDN